LDFRESKVSWLTKYGKGRMDKLVELREDKQAIQRCKHIKEAWMEMLRNAKQTPILDIGSITPARVMEGFILKQANQKTLKPLSPAGYGGKRMAVFHMIRCHNGKGSSQDFQDKMMSLWKGFSRTLNTKNETKKTAPSTSQQCAGRC
jgi:hypothetical protein